MGEAAKLTDFDLPISFMALHGLGFKFGNPPDNMFLIPCYTVGDGPMDIEIHYNAECVLKLYCSDSILEV